MVPATLKKVNTGTGGKHFCKLYPAYSYESQYGSALSLFS